MKVRLNADTLHHQVLRHPWHKLILHSLLQLLNLKKANVVSESGFFNCCCCLWDSFIFSVSLYLLCHVGLRQVVEDKSNLLLDILWRLHNPFRLISGHQQGVDVGCVYGGLQLGSGAVMFETDSSLRLENKSERIDKAHIKRGLDTN